MSINFDSLEVVETVNSRISYDVRYSSATGKFTLSEAAYNKYDINNNGFLLQRAEGQPVLQVVENEMANMHKGRSDAEQKGKTFTADGLKNMLGLDKEDAKYTFEEIEHEGETYLLLNDMDSEEEEAEEQSITASEENDSQVPSDDVEMNEGSGAVADGSSPSWNN